MPVLQARSAPIRTEYRPNQVEVPQPFCIRRLSSGKGPGDRNTSALAGLPFFPSRCGPTVVRPVEIGGSLEGFLRVPWQVRVHSAAAVAIPGRVRVGAAQRTEPTPVAPHQAVARHVEVECRIHAVGVEGATKVITNVP